MQSVALEEAPSCMRSEMPHLGKDTRRSTTPDSNQKSDAILWEYTLYLSCLNADDIDIKMLGNGGLLSHKAIHSIQNLSNWKMFPVYQ